MIGWLAYATVSLVWGSTYFAIVLALESCTAFGLVSIRFASAGIIAFLIGRLRRESWFTRSDLPHLIIVGALLPGCSNFLITWSEEYVASGIAAIFAAMVPIWLALLSLRKEALGVQGWFGLFLGFAGVMILALPTGETPLHLGSMIALIVAPFFWAFGTLHGRRTIKNGGLFTNISVEMLVATVLSAFGAKLTGGFLIGPPTWNAVFGLAYLSIFGSVIAFSAFIYLSKVWPPARMGTYAYLNPLVAVLLGSLVLGEEFGLRQLLALFVILAGVGLVQFRRRA